MRFEYTHFTERRASEVTEKVNALAAGGWRVIAITQRSPYNAMDDSDYTVFLERDNEYRDPGGAE